MKPNGIVTATVYDSKQRVISTVEKTATETVITGFEYLYDDLSRIVQEKHLDNDTKFCYTYDSLGRVKSRTKKNATTNAILSFETYSYDAAGNLVLANNDAGFAYDTNNRLISFNGNSVSYDLDGNMLSNGSLSCTYDSANRLISAEGSTYTYNAEDIRIRNRRADADTTYVYDTNVKLSRMLMKTTNGITTKYVYGLGLIGQEKEACFKTYHFDSRGSTVAITDESGTVTDTFAYDTYGKCISHVGSGFIIFGYNGRDGAVTDMNGLIYMRARYYSPDMRRFINADVVPGEISNAITLNRFAYANGNPVSFVDPFGLEAGREPLPYYDYKSYKEMIKKALQKTKNNIYNYHRYHGGFEKVVTGFDDACKKILSALENDTIPEEFMADVKIAIYIDPNYNTSGEEILGEIIGFIPFLGELYGLVDYMSNEDKNLFTLFESVFSLITQGEIADMTKYADELNFVGKLGTLMGVLDLIESFENKDSPSKITTSLIVDVDIGDSFMYRYSVLVDPNLMFKECSSSISAKEIKGDPFQLVIGE